MSGPNKLTDLPKTSRPALWAIAAGVGLVAFLAGFIPMWAKAENSARELRQAKRHYAIVNLQNTLGSATFDARRGQYEDARQQTSQFFTALRADMEPGSVAIFTPAQVEKLGPIVAQRDDVITLLARSDPASVDRLSELYLAYRKVIELRPAEIRHSS